MEKKAKTKEWYREMDIAHVLHGMTVPSIFHKSGSIMYDSGYGIRLVDLDGKVYMDGMMGGACCTVGYGREEIGEVSKEQIIRLSHYPNFGHRANLAEIELCAKLAEIAPAKIERFYTTNSGSDAVEVAVKAARFYWKEKGKKNKSKIISLEHSYHGSTAIAMSVTAEPFWLHPNLEPYVPGFLHVGMPICYRCPWGKTYPDCNYECAQALEEMIEKEGQDTVAAFLTEPMWVASGLYVPPPEYWPKVGAICKKHNVLMIIDEVLTGFGKSGTFWCSDLYGIKPDMLISSKGLAAAYAAIAVVGITDEIYKGLTAHDAMFPHVHTYGGHCVSCAIALKVIEITLNEKLMEKAAKQGEYSLKRLTRLKEESPYVGDVRGLGVHWGLELVADKKTKEPLAASRATEVVNRCYEKGVIIVTFGDNILRWGLAPVATMGDLEKFLDVVEWSVKAI